MPAAIKKNSQSKNSQLKKKVVKKVSKSSQPVKVDAPVKVADVTVNEPSDIVAPVEDVYNYSTEFAHLLGQLKTLQNTLKELTVYTSKLEKRVSKDQRVLQKRVNGKRRRKTNSDSPSGFAKPGPVSDELRSFLKLDKDELISRTNVTKRINQYCKDNGLQNEKDKRILNADKTLMKLLRLKKGEELTFFNLQKYMKIHFPNKEGVYPTA